MSVALARVPLQAQVPWTILVMTLRIEGEWMRTQCDALASALTSLQTDIQTLHETLSDLGLKVDALLDKASLLVEDTTPLWDDAYALCGREACDGTCRVCQEGEEDYEEDTTEKYCKRGRR